MSSGSFVVAVDAGGTSSRAALVADDGRVLGTGRGGRGNPVSAGQEAAGAAIASAIGVALATATDAHPGAAAGVTVALAGATVATDDLWLADALAGVGVRAPLTIAPDMLALFASGTPLLAGYGLVVGTGATAVRVAGGGVARSADGTGWLLGDDGSGFWVGRRVARAAVLALDGRGPATALTPHVLVHLGIDPEQAGRVDHDGRPVALGGLVATVYRASPLALAELARYAFAEPDDAVARAIVADAADELTSSLAAVRKEGLRGPVVIGGGVATAQPALVDAVLERLRADGVDGDVHRVTDGLAGAAVLALRGAGADVPAQVHARIVAGTGSAG